MSASRLPELYPPHLDNLQARGFFNNMDAGGCFGRQLDLGNLAWNALANVFARLPF